MRLAAAAFLALLASPLSAQEIEVTPLEPMDPNAVIIEERAPQMQPQVRMISSSRGTLRGVDKLDGALQDIEVLENFPILFGSLSITLRDCRYPADNPTGDAFAYVDIQEAGETIFAGWMIASSPALNALDHHRFDVWVLRCKTSDAEGASG